MSVTTSQQLNNYLQLYNDVELTFNKEVAATTGLMPEEVFFKAGGRHLQCVVYSLSLSKAKLLMTLTPEINQLLRDVNNKSFLRLCFKGSDKQEKIPFFISTVMTGYTPYNAGKVQNLFFINLDFTQRPPDTLIEILGQLLEAKNSAHARREERIIVNEKILNNMGMTGHKCQVIIDRVPRKIVLRDISFEGAKVLMMGMSKFLLDRQAILRIWDTDQNNFINIPGHSIRSEQVEGRKDIIALAIKFDDDRVPMGYKVKLTNFFKLVATRKTKPGKE